MRADHRMFLYVCKLTMSSNDMIYLRGVIKYTRRNGSVNGFRLLLASAGRAIANARQLFPRL